MASGLRVAALPLVDVAEADQDVRLNGAVAGLAAQGQGLPLVTSGLRVAALSPVDDAKADQHFGFGGSITGLAGGPEGAGVHGGRLGKVSAFLQMTGQGHG